jgi:hypothetical protein
MALSHMISSKQKKFKIKIILWNSPKMDKHFTHILINNILDIPSLSVSCGCIKCSKIFSFEIGLVHYPIIQNKNKKIL